jgi:two-component system nitrogen regulation sensor histidine kinase NtrY
VRKIIEEHDGSLALVQAEPFDKSMHCGAKAVITLPRVPDQNEIA